MQPGAPLARHSPFRSAQDRMGLNTPQRRKRFNILVVIVFATMFPLGMYGMARSVQGCGCPDGYSYSDSGGGVSCDCDGDIFSGRWNCGGQIYVCNVLQNSTGGGSASDEPVVCEGEPASNYCDCADDCFWHSSDWCSCAEAKASTCCNTAC